MSMSYTQSMQVITAGGGPAAAQLAFAVATAAVTVLSEDPTTTNHAARLTWAQKTLANPDYMARAMAYGVLADPNIQAVWPNQTDVQVQTSVNALVNGFLNA